MAAAVLVLGPLLIALLAAGAALWSPLVGAAGDVLRDLPIVKEAVLETEEDANKPTVLQQVIPWIHIPRWTLLILVASAGGYLTWRVTSRTQYVLTETHLFTARFAPSQSCRVVPIAQITSMQLARDPFDRLLGVWKIFVHTRGSSLVIVGVRDPAPLMHAYTRATARELPPLPEAATPARERLWSARLSGRGLASAVATYGIGPTLLAVAPEVLSSLGADTDLGVNGLVLAAALAIAGLVSIARLVRSEYEVSGGCVRVRNGVLGVHERHMDIARVADVQVRRPPLARLFRCGHVKVVSESGETLTLYGLSDPGAAHRVIEHFRAATGGPA